MTHILPRLLTVTPAEAADTFVGAENGPADKRAYGGHLAAQAFAAAGQTLHPGLAPTSLHVQFLRGGDAGAPVHYEVQRVYDGRTTASRRVLARQDGRLLVTATASAAYWVDQGQNGAPSTLYRFPVSPQCDGSFTAQGLGVRLGLGSARDLPQQRLELG